VAEKRERRTDERQREAVIGSPDSARSRIDDGCAVSFSDLQRVIVREAGVTLAAVGEFACRKNAKDRGDSTCMIA
jgi:hypothetical protein